MFPGNDPELSKSEANSLKCSRCTMGRGYTYIIYIKVENLTAVYRDRKGCETRCEKGNGLYFVRMALHVHCVRSVFVLSRRFFCALMYDEYNRFNRLPSSPLGIFVYVFVCVFHFHFLRRSSVDQPLSPLIRALSFLTLPIKEATSKLRVFFFLSFFLSFFFFFFFCFLSS